MNSDASHDPRLGTVPEAQITIAYETYALASIQPNWCCSISGAYWGSHYVGAHRV